MTDAVDLDLTLDWLLEDAMEPDHGAVAALLRYGLAAEEQFGAWSFSIRFVGDAEIAIVHGAFLGDPSPTDIITFPYDPEDGERGGDIVISVDTARVNAEYEGWTLECELAFLVLHGLLHTLGWDDATPTSREAMLDRQHAILNMWHNSWDGTI